MGKTEEILLKTENLLREGKLEEADSYINKELADAKNNNDKELQLVLLSEKISVLRDSGNIDKAIECCLESIKILDEEGVANTMPRAASYFNTANAYRAAHNIDKAYEYYDKTLKVLEICGDDEFFISYYNNVSALNQEAGKFDEAIECLKKVLYIVEFKLHDKLREAIARTNLSAVMLRIKRIDEAEEILKPAIVIFGSMSPTDYHYSAALSALGDINMVRGKLEDAAMYFEKALEEIELHMGKNRFYEIVEDNLASVNKMLGKK